jgi:hypothetical protein
MIDAPITFNSYLGFEVKRKMLHDLAGYAAGRRVEGGKELPWLDVAIESEDWEDAGHDIGKAITLARAACGTEGRAWALLRRMAAWADEAVSHPTIWPAIAALGEELVTVKRRMSGKRALTIMDAAGSNDWDGYPLPYLNMGRKWRRRLSFSPPMPE